MTKQELTANTTSKGTVFVSDAISVVSYFGDSVTQVLQNDNVLACAKDYLQLCSNLPQEVLSRLTKKRVAYSLPSDVANVERGVGVLCVAYAVAKNNHDVEVSNDVENELKGLSTFYQEKVAQAYFSACNVLFDADDVADKPEVLKQLQMTRDELQKVHFEWPDCSGKEDLTSFFEKVEMYGRQLGIEGRVQPEKKAERTGFFSHISPIVSVNSRGM
ncbi:MAG: hypothetical protein E7013_06285 [Alphaproteobacteria bacterium]|nr:hypothetical protein [Alphaproteobacteria bacterium]